MSGKPVDAELTSTASSNRMTADGVRGLLNAQPFGPFVLHLPSGKTVKVSHRDFAAISPTGRILVILGERDSETIVDVALIERADVGVLRK